VLFCLTCQVEEVVAMVVEEVVWPSHAHGDIAPQLDQTSMREEVPMVKILRGVVQGRTIELECEPGIENGRIVEVIVRSQALPGPPPGWRPGGTETAAGMMAEHGTEEDDRLLEAFERDRHRPSTREIPE
jgi:hypothetical protein